MDEKIYFKPNRYIARGIYNAKFDKIRTFTNGKGFGDPPHVKEDAIKFREGLKQIGIDDEDIKCFYDYSYDDFAILFRELNAQVDENAKAGEKTLVIFDVASHGFQDNFHFIVCNDENALKVNYPFENVMRWLASNKSCWVLAIFNACRQKMLKFRLGEDGEDGEED